MSRRSGAEMRQGAIARARSGHRAMGHPLPPQPGSRGCRASVNQCLASPKWCASVHLDWWAGTDKAPYRRPGWGFRHLPVHRSTGTTTRPHLGQRWPSVTRSEQLQTVLFVQEVIDSVGSIRPDVEIVERVVIAVVDACREEWVPGGKLRHVGRAADQDALCRVDLGVGVVHHLHEL